MTCSICAGNKCKFISLIEMSSCGVSMGLAEFVVMLLLCLYSCTFVNVDAVNGMSFTLLGESKKIAFWFVYIHHSFPLLNIMYTVLFDQALF